MLSMDYYYYYWCYYWHKQILIHSFNIAYIYLAFCLFYNPWYVLSCMWDGASKVKVAHVTAAGFLSRWVVLYHMPVATLP